MASSPLRAAAPKLAGLAPRKKFMHCPVCRAGNSEFFSIHSEVSYFECNDCGSLFADPKFLEKIETQELQNYDVDYWSTELKSAYERSFGSSPQRVAEVFLYSQIPIRNFIDVGTGPGFLLDALAVLLPSSKHIFHGVELYPPPNHTDHENYHVGSLADVPVVFDGGCCIEVIEHLTPDMLSHLVQQLSARSREGALYYFGSGQPVYVKEEDPEYLDPYKRGHIVSYSISGAEKIFNKHGFTLTPLPGRSWGFLAKFGSSPPANADELLQRIWYPVAENVRILKDPLFGPLMYHMGIESARCYLEHAISNERTVWARRLQEDLHNCQVYSKSLSKQKA